MSATVWIVLLWLGFAGSHMLLSSVRLRPILVERIGERGYAGVFSLVALGFFVPLVWVYFASKHHGAWPRARLHFTAKQRSRLARAIPHLNHT